MGDKTFSQLNTDQMFWNINEESNSIAVIVKHMVGNMLSRWTHFLTEDGEKDWRNRDQEFENTFTTKQEILDYWEKGWRCLFEALNTITEDNINSTIYIRGEAHTVTDAVLRQLAHYSYHVGQIVFIGKILQNENWETLSIPRNKSRDFNAEMFEKHPSNDINPNSSPVCFAKSSEIRDEYKMQ